MKIACDLFCGAGAAALGIKRAGFDLVIGFDIKKPSCYHGDIFVQCDLKDAPFQNLLWADFVFASPPCQLFSPATALAKRYSPKERYENLIPLTRKLIAGHPYSCIENVMQAPIRQNLILCGPQFGLGPDPEGERDGLWRKRSFELSYFAWQPHIPKMTKGRYVSIAGTFSASHHYNRRVAQGKPGSVPTHEAKAIMGIPQNAKMTRKEIAQAVAPPCAEYVAKEALARMREANYIPVQERKQREMFHVARKHAESLTEVPF